MKTQEKIADYKYKIKYFPLKKIVIYLCRVSFERKRCRLILFLKQLPVKKMPTNIFCKNMSLKLYTSKEPIVSSNQYKTINSASQHHLKQNLIENLPNIAEKKKYQVLPRKISYKNIVAKNSSFIIY